MEQPCFLPKNWKEKLLPYTRNSNFKSSYQLITTLTLFLATLFTMVMVQKAWSYWVLPLSVLSGFLLVRLFIIQHDCGHNSFFKNRTLNKVVGKLCAVFTFTPFAYWKRSHNIHHANTANLDKRGIGDILTLTKEEYLKLSWYKKLSYRIYRNPIILFTISSTLLFVVLNRIPDKYSKTWKERSEVFVYNAVLIALLTAWIYFLGWTSVLIVLGGTIVVASTAGTWLFYVQHQFEHTYWTTQTHWDYAKAALLGSSYYKLPTILHWFTGYIGYHHIHHLQPMIPNYNLAKCYSETPFLNTAKVLTIKTSLKAMFCHIWDNESQRLISFKELRKQRKACKNPSPAPSQHIIPLQLALLALDTGCKGNCNICPMYNR
jgi:acyl-lipid omega-6 desaturase (Delta-12 desaturase)